MSATNSSIAYVERDGKIPCQCQCASGQIDTFRSVWDRLCRQLFGAMPPSMDSEDQLPDIDIWKDGVALVDNSYPLTFVVSSDGETAPKPADVIEYKGRFYVIGTVKEQ